MKDAILDGEIVVLDKSGRNQFLDLMRRRRQDAAFCAFDILWLDGADLRGLGLLERKRILRKVIRGHDRILYAAHVERHGLKLFEAVCQRDCEGIVAKHRLGAICGQAANVVADSQSGIYAKARAQGNV